MVVLMPEKEYHCMWKPTFALSLDFSYHLYHFCVPEEMLSLLYNTSVHVFLSHLDIVYIYIYMYIIYM